MNFAREIYVIADDDQGAKEREVRDYFAQNLGRLRPHEHFAKKEQGYVLSRLRADMRTIDLHDTIREWEFKLHADYRAIGQILTYVALARKELGFRAVRGVVAAFSFADEVSLANEVMNLNLELVTLPDWMRGAGSVTGRAAKLILPKIPNIETRERNDDENS